MLLDRNKHNLHQTLREFIKFAITGVCNTGIHSSVFLLLVNYGDTQLIANIVAFSIAAIFSCLVNTFWSFKKKLTRIVIYRFVVVSLINLLVSSAIAAAADYFHVSKYITIVCVVCILPMVNFISHKFWTYNGRE